VLSFSSYRCFCSSQRSDMWVLQTGCSGITRDRGQWDPDSSKFAKKQDQPFHRDYIDGTIIEGGLYTDYVTIAGFTVCFV
jgi:hypothetical protein